MASDLPRLIPVDDFFENPEKAGGQISPDGRKLAYLAPEENRLNVWVRTLGSDDDMCVTHDHVRGVQGFLNISTRKSEWNDVISAAERNADVWATVGVHPHEADAHPDLGAAALVEGANHPRVIAIGECGLDYYYDKSDRAAQRERFHAHIEAARQTGLPLVVHTREAEADTAGILEAAVREGGVTGVLHCFTGSAELARKGLDLGFYVSLSGIVTFKNGAFCDIVGANRKTVLRFHCGNWKPVDLPLLSHSHSLTH